MGIKGPQSSTGKIGTQLSYNEIDNLFSEDQLVQLFDLYKASTGTPDMNETTEDSTDKKWMFYKQCLHLKWIKKLIQMKIHAGARKTEILYEIAQSFLYFEK